MRPTLFPSLLTKLQNMLGFATENLPPAPPKDEAEIRAIEGLVRQLKTESETLIGKPINHTILSLPSYFPLTRPDIARFVEANRRVGIRPLQRWVTRPATTLRPSYDINNCTDHWNPYMCDQTDFQHVVVSYDKAALTISFSSTSWQDFERYEMFLDLGADSKLRREAPETYWEEVTSKLREFVDQDTVKSLSCLSLHGESVTDPQFLQVMKETFDPNDALKAESYIHAPEEHLFAAAHGAAILARGGMEDGWVACIVPDHCPKPKDEF